MGKKVSLGGNYVDVEKPITVENKISVLEEMTKEILKTLKFIDHTPLKQPAKMLTGLNKDGIPIGMPLFGESTKGGTSHLTVHADRYRIGDKEYDSLSAAAEAVSGVRRSGWTFWKTPEGKSVKEEFGK